MSIGIAEILTDYYNDDDNNNNNNNIDNDYSNKSSKWINPLFFIFNKNPLINIHLLKSGNNVNGNNVKIFNVKGMVIGGFKDISFSHFPSFFSSIFDINYGVNMKIVNNNNNNNDKISFEEKKKKEMRRVYDVINSTDENVENALQRAIADHNLEIAKFLIKTDLFDLHHQNESSETALDISIKGNFDEIARLLLVKSFDFSHKMIEKIFPETSHEMPIFVEKYGDVIFGDSLSPSLWSSLWSSLVFSSRFPSNFVNKE